MQVAADLLQQQHVPLPSLPLPSIPEEHGAVTAEASEAAVAAAAAAAPDVVLSRATTVERALAAVSGPPSIHTYKQWKWRAGTK